MWVVFATPQDLFSYSHPVVRGSWVLQRANYLLYYHWLMWEGKGEGLYSFPRRPDFYGGKKVKRRKMVFFFLVFCLPFLQSAMGIAACSKYFFAKLREEEFRNKQKPSNFKRIGVHWKNFCSIFSTLIRFSIFPPPIVVSGKLKCVLLCFCSRWRCMWTTRPS